MTIFQAIVLGIVQGATEFIPVSSSGHLVLVPWLLGWETPGLTFSVAVHFGTMFGVLIYFWRDWVRMIRGGIRWLRERDGDDPDARLLALLLLGTVPAIVAGALFFGFLKGAFESPLIAALLLLVTAALLWIGEWLGKTRRRLENLTWRDSLIVGLAQVVAFLPGISRSGSTITAGRLRDVQRDDAARFSFLLATPVILAAVVMELVDLFRVGLNSPEMLALLAGFLSALISGYLVIRWLLAFLRTRSTGIFAAYCVVASLISLLVLLLRGT